MDAAGELRRLEPDGTTERALALFDALPPVPVEAMRGAWRGSEVPTGHPLDGLLERYGWHGKRFDDAEAVHPLVCTAADGARYGVNPALLPLAIVVRHPGLARAPLVADVFRRVGAVLRTVKPRARLRMTEYRGVLSATMVYDALPILDVFRRVDADTVLGAMDLRGVDEPFFFVLRRERDETGVRTC